MKKYYQHILLGLVLCIAMPLAAQEGFYKGVDLSYVNEMEDCGAVYKENGVAKDPYQIFADHGANLVRIRLWHTPDWTNYSNLKDVKKSIRRAREKGMQVLLDFHYSDTWADPEKQHIPAAWENVETVEVLGQKVYDYTYETLMALDQEGLMPELVQIGNETNGNIMVKEGEELYPVDFDRMVFLMKEGIKATKEAGAKSSIQPKTVIHVAGPKDVKWWFSEAVSKGLTNFDIIGISYYPKWHSEYNIQQLGEVIDHLKATYSKDVMIVETGHPWTEEGVEESAGNVMNESAPGYDAPSPKVQRQYMIDLTTEVYQRGGLGVIYWEPAWVSTPCQTLWGTGSHWENITFFDFEGALLSTGGIQFLSVDYSKDLVLYSDLMEVLQNDSIYPNPASNYIYLKGEKNSVSWEVHDLNGKCVLKAENMDRLDISSLQEGIYILSVNQQQQFRLLKN
ncbi:glycosyl hydrolase 53 family protein [Algivirga pacifica]|uniref:Arabinogalactan endo-beta-1,4-galactanase n=1 Tax=Algivirga pacifica TaxID=1162670 RepID=A0ABP9D8V0_9BACT